MKKNSLVFVVVVFLLVLLAASIEIKEKNIEDVSGRVVLEPDYKIVNSDETIEIEKDDLTECCSFMNEQGVGKTCFALNNFNCDYCNNFC